VNKILRPLTAEVRKAAKELGFTVRGSLAMREDSLIRAIQVDMMQNISPPGTASFDLLFDLGIPGISVFAPCAREWVVRCHGRKFPLGDGPAKESFALTGGPGDEKVIENSISCLREACSEFLLRYEDCYALYRFVRDSAIGFADLGMELRDDYRRLSLEPWNALRRLELAGIYAAFLGLHDEADSIETIVERLATVKRGLDIYLPQIHENIAAARRGSVPNPNLS
jgi:hypothetical protein